MNCFNKHILNVSFLKLFCFNLGILFSIPLVAQDIHFSQLSQTQFFSNPAFAGIQYGPRVLAHYRNEYPTIGSQINSGFNTFFLSFDQFLADYNSGLGGQMIADKFGENIYSRYYINLNYAYQLKFNEYHAVRLGLAANFIHQQIDRNKLVFYDQIDPINGFNHLATEEKIDDNLTQSYFDFHAGAVYFTHNFYVGISGRNLIPKTDKSNSNYNPLHSTTISLQSGAAFWLNREKRIALYPYLLLDRQYGYSKVVGNILYQYEILNLGLGFRHNVGNLESIILLAGLNLNKLRISYSYDIGTSSLKSYSGGSHEIGIRFLLKGDDNSLHPNEYKNISFCPEFLKN